MDVGGAALDRAGDELIDEADDRHLARQIAQPVDILEQLVVGADLGGGAGDLAERRLLGLVEPRIGGLEIRRQGDARQDPLAARHLDRARGVIVERIDHGDDQALAAVGERQHARHAA